MLAFVNLFINPRLLCSVNDITGAVLGILENGACAFFVAHSFLRSHDPGYHFGVTALFIWASGIYLFHPFASSRTFVSYCLNTDVGLCAKTSRFGDSVYSLKIDSFAIIPPTLFAQRNSTYFNHSHAWLICVILCIALTWCHILSHMCRLLDEVFCFRSLHLRKVCFKLSHDANNKFRNTVACLFDCAASWRVLTTRSQTDSASRCSDQHFH
jgi:hypothetical protein